MELLRSDEGEEPRLVEQRPERRMPARLRPRPTAATAIVGDLRRTILDMSLPPGSPLSEKVLIERFGMSRTPIREALIRLAEEGLVEIFPQAGTFVGRIPVEALPEAVIVRQALELAALRFVVERADQADYDRLEGIIARHEAFARLDDREGFHVSDEAFHEALAVISGYPGLWRVAQQAKSQIDRCRRLTLPVPGRMAIVIREHRAVLAALMDRDHAGAEAAMRAHLCAVLPDIPSIRARHPNYFV